MSDQTQDAHEKQVVTDAIEAELKVEHEHHRKSVLDAKLLKARYKEIFDTLASGAGHLEPDAPPRLPVYTGLLADRIAVAERATEAHEQAHGGQTRYSPATYELSSALYKECGANREKLKERLGHSVMADAIRTAFGVGAIIAGGQPQDVLKLARMQSAALGSADTQAFLTARELNPARMLKRVTDGAAALDASIKAGVASSLAGEASDAADTALLAVEIVLSRAIAFLDEYGASADAAKLRDRFPRKAVHHGAPPVDPPATADNKPAEVKK
jgi:hypothetical protein